MITLLTGSPGHGKSYTTVKLIDDAVGGRGVPVATNVPLRGDWAFVMARRHTLFGRWRPETVARKAAEYERLVLVCRDINELVRVRFAGEGEGRAEVIVDEAHRELNPRVNLKGASRLAFIDWLSGHRHYGANVTLVTQSEGNIDTQVRALVEFRSEVRNFKKLPWFPFPMNLFLRRTFWNDRAKTRAGVSLYTLNKGLARLYHTHALALLDWPADAIELPRPIDPDSLKSMPGSADEIAWTINAIPQEVPLPPPARAEEIAEWQQEYLSPPSSETRTSDTA